jgi:hypothetical protein
LRPPRQCLGADQALSPPFLSADCRSVALSAAAAGRGKKPAIVSAALIAVIVALMAIAIAISLFVIAKWKRMGEEAEMPGDEPIWFGTQEAVTEASPMTALLGDFWEVGRFVEEGSLIW